MEKLFLLVDAGFPDEHGVAQHPGGTVVSPYAAEGVGQISRSGPLAGHLAYAQVNLSSDVGMTEGSQIGAAIAEHAPTIDGLEALPGGRAFAEAAVPKTELIGIAFAIAVLILAFGSVLAMGLPLAVALVGVGAGVGLLGDRFGGGFNGPFIVTVQPAAGGSLGSVFAIRDALAAAPGVSAVTEPIVDDPSDAHAAVMTLIATT